MAESKRPIRRPMRIEILGLDYEVEFVDGYSREEELRGRIIFTEGKIKIDSKLSEDQKKETLLHKILHGIAEGAGIEDKLNEKTIHVLSRTLYSLFKNKYLDFLWQGFERKSF